MSGIEVREFMKENYSVSNLMKKQKFEPFNEEKWIDMIKSARDSLHLKKSGSVCDINFKTPYRGQ